MNIQIISDKEILHPNTFEAGPRVTRVQVVQVDNIREEHSFWTQNGKFHHISTRTISK
jgi:hypothetical protein